MKRRPFVVTTNAALMLALILLLAGCGGSATASPTTSAPIGQPTAAIATGQTPATASQPSAQLQGDRFETASFSIIVPKGWEKTNVDGGIQIYKASGEIIEVHFRGSNQSGTHAKEQAERNAQQYSGTKPEEVNAFGKSFWKTTFTAASVLQTSYLRIENGILISIKLAGKDHETNKDMKAILDTLVFKEATAGSNPAAQNTPFAVAKTSTAAPTTSTKPAPTTGAAATKPAVAGGVATPARTPLPMHSLEGLAGNNSAQIYSAYKAYEAFPVVKLGTTVQVATDALKAAGMVEMQASRPGLSNAIDHFYWFESASADKADKIHIKLEITADKVLGKAYMVPMSVAKDTGFVPLQTVYRALQDRFATGQFKTLADVEAVLGKGFVYSERYALTDNPSAGINTRYIWRGARGTTNGVIEITFDDRGGYKGSQGVGLMN